MSNRDESDPTGSSSVSPSTPSRHHTRNTSNHTPVNPSRLRESISAPRSTEDLSTNAQSNQDGHETRGSSRSRLPQFDGDADLSIPLVQSPIVEDRGFEAQAKIREPTPIEATVRTRLLEDYHRGRVCGSDRCDHGTFSPHGGSSRSKESSVDSRIGFGGRFGGSANDIHGGITEAITDRIQHNGQKTKLSTTEWLAQQYGISNHKRMYLQYYFPATIWIRQYRWEFLRGDLVAALTMASFYIPMSLSLASNLGHIPPINGLYSFVFNPIIYALLGSCPQMVVGPEAAGSLLVGTVVRSSVDRGNTAEDNDIVHAQIAGVVTGMAGAIIFVAGITRLGFLDSVLSRPFLRGFISAIGFVILVDQLIPEIGLAQLARTSDVDHGSSVGKLIFLVKNIGQAHGLTAAVSLGSLAIIMVCREIKNRLQPRYPSVAYVPDRFMIVVLSAILTWQFEWDKKGLPILGHIKSAGSNPFPIHWPFQPPHMKHIENALSTSFIISLLGFFESSVAAKSLGEGSGALQGISLSANRELVALGVANLVGGCFMALPAFGGYGRSKVNKSTGGTTPMSSIILSLITILCVLFLVPYFYYLPKGVLSAMISVVAYSLIEECPHDINFFLKIRGWTELSLMAIIFLATIFYSLTLGIALGIGLSILRLIRHSTKARIQILGKVPGTDRFENAELNPDAVEFIEGCLICKIPEPLTFANTAELKSRLRRLEYYGTNAAHPSLPRVRAQEHNRNMIFDVHGVTSIDGSGTQVLSEIVESYVKNGVRIIFCRLPSYHSQVYQNFLRSGIVENCGGESHFVSSVDEALRLTELEDLEEDFIQRPNGA